MDPVFHQETTYFLNGVVTGSEWLKLGFITSGFSLICGPSDDRLTTGRPGGGEDGITGGGRGGGGGWAETGGG